MVIFMVHYDILGIGDVQEIVVTLHHYHGKKKCPKLITSDTGIGKDFRKVLRKWLRDHNISGGLAEY